MEDKYITLIASLEELLKEKDEVLLANTELLIQKMMEAKKKKNS